MITEKRILIAEDDEASAELLKTRLEKAGYEIDHFFNGKDALDAYEKEKYPLVITDLEMPRMSGEELIDEIKKINTEQVIIVTTMFSDSDIIIRVMKLGVYDYIVKPVNLDSILLQVKRAFEADELYRTRAFVEHERMIRLENQIEWMQWNKELVNRDNDRVDKALFQSLNNSFNQGAGFGALLSLINIIAGSVVKDEENYIIPADLFDLIQENAIVAEKTLNFFSRLSEVMGGNVNKVDTSCREMHDQLKKLIISDEIIKLTKINNHKIMLSDYQSELDFISKSVDNLYMHKAFEEVLVNALKFSEPNTSIVAMMQPSGDRVTISVLNTPRKNDKSIIGIPHEYQNVVFEPFFRLVKIVFEAYGTLDYGLGLTLVDKIVRVHGGRIDIGNVMDHSDVSKNPVLKVLAQVII